MCPGCLSEWLFPLDACASSVLASMTFFCSRKRLWITAVMRRRALSLVWRFPGAEAGARRDLGETDLRWIDAKYQIADCLTKHASRKSEAVLQKILQEAQWRITAEEDMLDRRKQEREIRNSSSYDEELWPTSE